MEQIQVEGPHPFTVRSMRPEDEAGVARVLEACDDYFVAATGSPTLPADVQSLYYALPEGAGFEQKRLLVLCDGATVVGVVDAVEGHPDASTCSVGLFVLVPELRREGIGTRAAQQLLKKAAARGLRRMTATCPEDWTPGLAFLESLDFEIRTPKQKLSSPVGNHLRLPAERELCTAVRELREDTDRAPAEADGGDRDTS